MGRGSLRRSGYGPPPRPAKIPAGECRPGAADRVTGNWLLVPGVRLGRLVAGTLGRIAARQHACLAIDDVLRPPGSYPERQRIFSLVHVLRLRMQRLLY